MSLPNELLPVGLLATPAAGGGGAYEIERSLRFDSSATSYLNRTPEVVGNRKTWTWAGWVKRSNTSGDQFFFSARSSTPEDTSIAFNSSGNIVVFTRISGTNRYIYSNASFRDFSAWMHVVCAFDTTQSTESNRVRLYVNGTQLTYASASYPPQNADGTINNTELHNIGNQALQSQYFNGYLADVHFIDGQALDPTSFGEFDTNGVWQPIEYTGSYGTNGFHLPFSDNSSTIALGTDTSVTVSAAEANKGMDVVTYTGNGSTQTINGLRFAPDFVWIKNRNGANNNVLQDSVRGFGSTKNLSSNQTQTEGTDIDGVITGNTSDGFIVSVNGQVGRGTNTTNYTYVAWCWKAGGPAVTNTNGSITSRVSANQNYGFSIVTYTGTGTTGTVGHGLNSAVKFVVIKRRNAASQWRSWHSGLLSTQGIDLNESSAAFTDDSFNNTIPTSSVFTVNGGVANVNASSDTYVAYCWSEVSGFSKFGSYTGNGSSSGPTITTGFRPRYILIKGSTSATDWLIWDSKRNLGYGALAANLSNAESYFGATNSLTVSDTGFQITTTNAVYNTNSDTYIYAAFASEPGNNWALNNFVANASSTGFKAVTYTGNGSTQTISGLGFSPDLVWIKARSAAYSHLLADSVRGPLYTLQSDGTSSEQSYGCINSFDSTGFTVDIDGTIGANNNGTTYVAWCWDAGSSTVSNTDGTITSSVRANTTTGFSVVSYTGNNTAGATVGHGLGAAPGLLIVKSRNQTGQYWHVWHSSLADNEYIYLNTTGAVTSGSDFLNSTRPGSSTFTLGSGNACNKSADPVIAYCFAPKPGVSAFGSYTGNGSSTGPVVTTGFQPAFLMVKRTDSTGNWVMLDSARNPSNPRNTSLYADTSDADYTPGQNWANFTANGFQPTATYGEINASGGTYIYMAFASAADAKDIDSLVDSATNGDTANDTGLGNQIPGNYATFNPLNGSPSFTYANGNLDLSFDAVNDSHATTTIAVKSGVWYCEGVLNSFGGNTGAGGFCVLDGNLQWNNANANSSGRIEYRLNGGIIYNGSVVTTVATYTVNDVIGIWVDATNNQIKFYKNNTLQHTQSSLNFGSYMPGYYGNGGAGRTVNATINTGQRAFAYTAPSGFKALCTTNLPTPTIADGSTAMDVKLYTGNGSTQTISGLGFSPDLVWIKDRSIAVSHNLFDQVRGTGKVLFTNTTSAEGGTTGDLLGSFNSDGFQVNVNYEGGFGGSTNNSSDAYAAWTWDAGSSTVTNTSGSISSQVRANPSAGFSIVTYTGNATQGASVGHGLGAAPSMMIVKRRNSAANWAVGHSGLGGWNKVLYLNLTDSVYTQSEPFNGTAPSSTVFQLWDSSATNASGDTYVAYCFAPVAGYSSAFSFTGTGTDPGPFIYLGFRPKLILVKRTDSGNAASHWRLIDMTINPYNVADTLLYANSSAAEITEIWGEYDALSNGFRVMTPDSNQNASGGTYIGFAWAEHPFQTARAR